MGCQCLKVIEGVAITTEEAQFKRTTKALEMALERHEERKRPKLELKFKGKEPPFSFKPGAEESIEFRIVFKEGDVATGAEAWFFAPKGFEFSRSTPFTISAPWYQSDDYPLPNALTAKVILGDLRRWFKYEDSLTIKTPSEVGEYRLGYRLYCDVSHGDFTWFKIKIE
jgi:hypothetical protein